MAGCTHSLHGYKTTLSLGSRFQNSRCGNGIVSCDLLFLKINVHTKGKGLVVVKTDYKPVLSACLNNKN